MSLFKMPIIAYLEVMLISVLSLNQLNVGSLVNGVPQTKWPTYLYFLHLGSVSMYLVSIGEATTWVSEERKK